MLYGGTQFARRESSRHRGKTASPIGDQIAQLQTDVNSAKPGDFVLDNRVTVPLPEIRRIQERVQNPQI